MADFNINALGAFRNIDFGNADAIVNIKQGGGVGQNGKLGNFFCKMFRSSAAAKEKLVGKTAKIVVPVQAKQDGPYEFKPLVVDGKEVVRPLTAEDVDTIGKACLFNSVNI
jgi:hypothetical protein